MRRKILTALALTGVLALGFGGAAAAAEDDTWGPGWGIGRMFGWGRGMMGAEEQLDRIDGRLAYMKTELKITDAQTAAWNDFASVVKTTAETHNAMMKEMMDGMRDGSFLEKPLPDRLVIQQTHIEFSPRADQGSQGGGRQTLCPADQRAEGDRRRHRPADSRHGTGTWHGRPHADVQLRCDRQRAGCCAET